MEAAAIPSDQRRCVPRDPVGVRIIESPAQPLWIICIRSTTLTRSAVVAEWRVQVRLAGDLASYARNACPRTASSRLSRRRGWGRLRQGVALPGAASQSPVPDASGWFTGTTPRFIQPGLVGRSRDLCMGQVTRSPPIRVPVSRPAIGMSRVVPYLFLRRRYAIETGFDAGAVGAERVAPAPATADPSDLVGGRL